MAHYCPICGTVGAACGTPTATTTVPVDAIVCGFRVAGNRIVPDVNSVMPADMTADEREEFAVMSAAYERRKLRNQIGAQGMAEGKAPHTSLSYVTGTDGITRKMHRDVAQQYVDLNPGSEIVREGALPVAKEGEIIGATKARTGEVFGADGRQKQDVQLLTSRTFSAEHRANAANVMPPVSGNVVPPTSAPAPAGATATAATPAAAKPVAPATPAAPKPTA